MDSLIELTNYSLLPICLNVKKLSEVRRQINWNFQNSSMLPKKMIWNTDERSFLTLFRHTFSGSDLTKIIMLPEVIHPSIHWGYT